MSVEAPVTVAWPGVPATAGPDGVRVIGVPGQPDRATARLRIRAALTAALAARWGVDGGRIGLHSPEGAAPWASVGVDGGERRIALAISHDGELSVAAFRDDGGAVGIDVSRVVPVPDWDPVARDYLGPAVAARLAALPAAARDAAFARAWSDHEARLKCLGLPLDEWRAERMPALQACRCFALALPAGYVGCLALGVAGAAA